MEGRIRVISTGDIVRVHTRTYLAEATDDRSGEILLRRELLRQSFVSHGSAGQYNRAEPGGFGAFLEAVLEDLRGDLADGGRWAAAISRRLRRTCRPTQVVTLVFATTALEILRALC
jgi:hypothetical protein